MARLKSAAVIKKSLVQNAEPYSDLREGQPDYSDKIVVQFFFLPIPKEAI